jgi:dTDP-4-dehydrorhamnose 3,5-epimerase-like enzyme
LSGKKQNKLFCPKGFLHGFLSAAYDEDGNKIDTNYFQYFCDAVFDKQSEVDANPRSIIDSLKTNIQNKEDMEIFNKTCENMDNIILSNKDTLAKNVMDILVKVLVLWVFGTKKREKGHLRIRIF